MSKALRFTTPDETIIPTSVVKNKFQMFAVNMVVFLPLLIVFPYVMVPLCGLHWLLNRTNLK